jgi:O-antigen ligase
MKQSPWPRTVPELSEGVNRRHSLGLLVAISVGTASVMWMTPPSVFSTDILPVMAVTTLFTLLLTVVLGCAIAHSKPAKVLVYRLILLIWWFLLVCEVVFERTGDSSEAYQSHFSAQAYGEGIVWGLAFLVLAILSIQQPVYLRHLFSRPYKWITLFAAVCLASVSYSPGRTYAGAWGFKLLLVVLLLQFGASMLVSLADIVTFLKVTLSAFFVLTIAPAIEALSNSSTAFEGVGGRLNYGPDALAMRAALLLLISVILYSLERRKIMLFTGLVGSAVMLMSMGKTAIIACVFSVLLFFLLQRQVARSVAVLLGVALVALAVLTVTPVGNHLAYYHGTATFTGRTLIWVEAVGPMRQKWLLGHGYLSTNFFALDQSGGLLADFVNLHNGFLEVAYNNGIIGVAVLLTIHFVMLRNIFRCFRGAANLRSRGLGDRRSQRAYLLAVGSLALYANLAINGLFNASFGGKAMSPFMLFLALFVMVDLLRGHIAEVCGTSLGLRRGSVAVSRPCLDAHSPVSSHYPI